MRPAVGARTTLAPWNGSATATSCPMAPVGWRGVPCAVGVALILTLRDGRDGLQRLADPSRTPSA